MRQHLAEPLSLPAVSRVARFAPGHFARLLRRSQGVTFLRCLLRMRIDHAKHLLRSTSLNVQRIAELSGFKSRTHFQRVFRGEVGKTPIGYRNVAESVVAVTFG
jgi:AraC family transcriptional regulator